MENLSHFENVSFEELEMVEGGANACEWGVGFAGFAIGGIYSAAATAIGGPVAGYLVGAATAGAFIEISSHC
ncbi:Blp family class II bacteriocin [Enterococcus sp. MJM12]|uniref:Blp family class II bacteriocin n=1 Tax=Candidatus Enterococcus myersii TaxID=2815322 RepID=A0ABS3H6U8_9ENTE|nr:Blp family class II bacteriocin [Enterococcus sp. MJM12]MBO0449184.1 Blp family class II bacteriocin [Enterococcus sp. MJM12]